MNKDFDIAYNEYAQQFVELINRAGMPMVATANILKDLLSQVEMGLDSKYQQYEMELRRAAQEAEEAKAAKKQKANKATEEK